MKFSLQHVRYCRDLYKWSDEPAPNGVNELVEKIGAQLGAVEEVIDVGKKYQGIVIAKVVKCEKHQGADKLKVCSIDDGGITPDVKRDSDGLVRVVCGAPNVREGLLVAWLPPGTTVPSSYGKEPFVLEAREIRGEVSNGMLASAKELALSDDHSGILEFNEFEVNAQQSTLDSETSKIMPGDDFAEVFGLNDFVIDIENKMFTHRPDLFGMMGIARELVGIQQLSFKSPDWYKPDIKLPNVETDKLALKVANNVSKLVPRFSAIVMSNIKVRPSPLWLQTLFAKLGMKSINNIVDYTNYYMYLTGQPLHAYDYDKLAALAKGKEVGLETRMSKKGERLKLLGGKELTFEDDSSVLITSNDTPVGIGGVMGGSETEVDENTKTIVLECANFDMYSIRRTSMKYGLFTDAATRFTKGQSPHQTLPVLGKIVAEIRESAGGKVASEVKDNNHATKELPFVRVNSLFVNERLGLNLTPSEIKDLLLNVEFNVEQAGNHDQLHVTPPFWRTDIEIPEDIVEEVGRLYGYDKLPLELPSRPVAPAPRNSHIDTKYKIRKVLAAAGANEALTYSFVHGNLLEKVGQKPEKSYKIANALSPDLQYYRLSLTPNLLEKVHPNTKAGFDEFALFEIGKVHMKGVMDPEEPNVPQEDEHLALVIAIDEKTVKRHYAGAPYFMAKRYLSAVAPDLVRQLVPLDSFDFKDDEWGKQMAAPYEPKRSGIIVREGLIWGIVGEFKHSVARQLKLPEFTAGFEVDINALTDVAVPTYQPISKYPSVQQDISLRVNKTTLYETVYDFIWQNINAPEHTTFSLDPLDIYQKDNDKHITLRLTIASYQKTMTDDEVNTLLDDVARTANKSLGAERI